MRLRAMRDRYRRIIGKLFTRLESPGLTARQERWLNGSLALVVALIAAGWTVAIAGAAAGDQRLGIAGELTANPFAPDAPPPAAFVLDRLVRMVAEEGTWRGESGAVRAIIADPADTASIADTLGLDALPPGTRIELEQVDSPGVRATDRIPADRPGAWNVLVRARNEVRKLTGLAVLTPVSADLIQGGRIGEYRIGEWPGRAARSPSLRTAVYDAPRGLIRVTPENLDVQISEHLVLGDFLTKGQENVWPKYVVISPRVLDKFELTLQELERSGHPVEDVGIISAFRTPYYNAHGGSTAGRGSVSRHMYGDAVDFYIDNDGDGRMDDLNGDGRVDRADAQVVAQAAERVEQRYPKYIGGIGIYRPNPGAHAGFVHIDTRGYRARW